MPVSTFRDHALGIAPSDRYGPAAAGRAACRDEAMADGIVPHFQNDAGVQVIEIGAREFMCIGASVPDDHPHVFSFSIPSL